MRYWLIRKYTQKGEFFVMSKLLIQEPPLQVLPSLAKEIGLNESIVIQQLHYWLENSKVGFEKDGFKWVANTYDEWLENFPFWSIATIKRIFSGLEQSNLVVSGQFEKSDWNQRKAYRVNYETLDSINLIRSNDSNRDALNRNTETTTENDDSFSETNTAYNRGEQERPDKVTEYIKMMNFPGAKMEARIDATLSYLAVALTRNTHTKEWQGFAKYIISEQKKNGWEVETFVKWLLSQKGYDPQYWSVKKMQEFYPQAFVEVRDEEKTRLL